MQKQIIKNTALVLEGGGFRGIFTAGILEVFLENGLIFDYAIGVSAGASYGASYASQQPGRNLEVNKFIGDKRYFSIRNFLKEGSLFSWNFILEEIPQRIIPFDYEWLKHTETRFWVGVTNCISGQAEYLNLNDASIDEFKPILASSCSLPLISSMVEYKGGLYLDGGLADSIPVHKALADGNSRAIVILTRPKGYVKQPVKHKLIFKFIYKKYPKVCEVLFSRYQNYNKVMDELADLEKDGKVFIIRPSEEISVSRLENDPAKTEKVFYSAIDYANKILPQLKSWLDL